MALDGAGHLSQFVQLDVVHFMADATGFLAEYQRVFWVSQIFPNRFRVSLSSIFPL